MTNASFDTKPTTKATITSFSDIKATIKQSTANTVKAEQATSTPPQSTGDKLQQNGGKLSKSRRDFFSELTDDEIEKMEEVIRG